MELKHTKQLALSYAKAIVDQWFVVVSIIGAVLFSFSFFFEQDQVAHKIIGALGTLILVSGIFSAFTRWLSVHGIVKKTLHDILYGDEYLREPENFDLVWDKLLNTSINQYMPKLKPHVPEAFLRDLLPATGSMFYSAYQQHFEVSWLDRDQSLVEIIETSDICVETLNAKSHKLKYSFKKNFPDNIPLDYEIQALSIDAKNLVKEVDIDRKPSNGRKYIDVSYAIHLEGKDRYLYFRKSRRVISLKVEPTVVVIMGHHTVSPRVSVKCVDAGLRAYFESTGTMETFDTIDGTNGTSETVERYNELLLRGQGYVICFGAE